MITGINIVRNCIDTGYPFVESILSAYPMCDEYIVNDGGSTDGTLEVLHEMQTIYPNLTVLEIPDTENIRWDSVSNQINHMIKKAKGDWIFLANADELIHERDAMKIRHFLLSTEYPIARFDRKEIKHNWSKLTSDNYFPTRAARNVDGLRQDWNSYGGDEFLVNGGWIDPQRTLKTRFIIYHFYNMFPLNKLRKLKNDAEYLAPGDKRRVKIYEDFKKGKPIYIKPTDIYVDLPALSKGLPYMEEYYVRKCLLDKKWVEIVTGLNYSSTPGAHTFLVS